MDSGVGVGLGSHWVQVFLPGGYHCENMNSQVSCPPHKSSDARKQDVFHQAEAQNKTGLDGHVSTGSHGVILCPWKNHRHICSLKLNWFLLPSCYCCPARAGKSPSQLWHQPVKTEEACIQYLHRPMGTWAGTFLFFSLFFFLVGGTFFYKNNFFVYLECGFGS